MKRTLMWATHLSLLTLLLSGCAGRFAGLYTNQMAFQNKTTAADFDFDYNYDILQMRGAKKYVKKETKKGVKLVGVRVTNKTDQSLIFGEDLLVFGGGAPRTLMTTEETYRSLRQKPPVYLLYLLLTPLRLTITANQELNIPIGLGVGPLLALGNMGVSSGANQKLKTELTTDNLLGRTIAPGETVHGLIALRQTETYALSLDWAQ